MKGPVVFLVSLVAVAALGATVVLPAFKEKQALVKEGGGGTRPDGASISPDRIRGAATALREKLGVGPDGWPETPGERGKALAALVGATVESPREDGVTLTMEWNRLPRLLVALAEPVGPTLELVTATPTENAGQCRVTVSFHALPDAPEGD